MLLIFCVFCLFRLTVMLIYGFLLPLRYIQTVLTYNTGDRQGSDRMVVWLKIPVQSVPNTNKTVSSRGVFDKTLYDETCQWLGLDRWFSAGIPVSSINKTDRHDIAEILLKVTFNTIISNPSPYKTDFFWTQTCIYIVDQWESNILNHHWTKLNWFSLMKVAHFSIPFLITENIVRYIYAACYNICIRQITY